MIRRCEVPLAENYRNYGGRGIKVCARWRGSFETFLADVGPKPSSQHSIDRFPNREGDYEPGNVRWATRTQQNRNRRNNKLTIEMATTIRQRACAGESNRALAALVGVSETTVRRIVQGRIWKVDAA